jgi:hypothetical protein
VPLELQDVNLYDDVFVYIPVDIKISAYGFHVIFKESQLAASKIKTEDKGSLEKIRSYSEITSIEFVQNTFNTKNVSLSLKYHVN